MIQIKTQATTWYVKTTDEAYKVASFLDRRGIDYDTNIIRCRENGIEYTNIQLMES